MAEKIKSTKEPADVSRNQQTDQTKTKNNPLSTKQSDTGKNSIPTKKNTSQTNFVSEAETADETVKIIEPTDLKSGDLILDIRSFWQHHKMSLNRPHWHVPAQDIDPQKFIKDYQLDGTKTLNIICTSGRKSAEAAKRFIQTGFKNVTSVAGGMRHASEQGLEMIEHPVWDMQEQIRFSAGLIVFVSCILGVSISGLFYLIPLLIGVGLMLSAITGNCILEKILNEMPWNK